MGFIEMKILHYTVNSVLCLSTWELKVSAAAQYWSSFLEMQSTLLISCKCFGILSILPNRTVADFSTVKVFLGALTQIY